MSVYPTFTRALRVAEFDDKCVLQTEVLGEDGITVIETLVTYDGVIAILIERYRFGLDHSDMRTYPRDSEFLIGKMVRLRYA
jgi:hypothetical protein